jgi:DNA-binding GntR family transcriptional regulator
LAKPAHWQDIAQRRRLRHSGRKPARFRSGPAGVELGVTARMKAVVSADPDFDDHGDAAEIGDAPASLREKVYEDLRYRLITGRIVPGVGISTRGLAQEMGVSQMPVRDALSRIAAEGAVEIRSKRAVMVPRMTPARFDEIMQLRKLLEPMAATVALPHITPDLLRQIQAADEATDAALAGGDVRAYMESNHRFHSLIYGAAPLPLALRMIESLWMQFGPFMRVVYGRYGTANMVDQHRVAIAAIAAGDAASLSAAILADIGDCADLMQDWERANT